MEHTIPRDDPPPRGVKSWQLWFSLTASTAAWAVHLPVVYGLTSLTCERGWFPFEVAGLGGLKVVQIILTLAASAVTVFAGFLAYQNQRQLADKLHAGADRHRFMATLGFALSTLYTALIALSVVPILALPSCAL